MKTKGRGILFCLILQLLVFTVSLAQGNIAVGTWRFHLSYSTIHALAGNHQTVFALGNNSLFYFSPSEGKPRPLSKIDGLYGHEFQKIAFSPLTKTLVISYTDGTIDLLQEKNIRRLDAIRTNPLIHEKSIHEIHIQENTAWLATAFGIAKIDLEQHQVMDAFLNIGPNGATLAVKDVVETPESIYFASEEGVFKGSTGSNLKDFRNWQLITSPEINFFSQLARVGSTLFALGSDQKIYRLENDQLEWIIGSFEVSKIKTIQNQLYFIMGGAIYSMEEDGSFTASVPAIDLPFNDFIFLEEQLFLATQDSGTLFWPQRKTIIPNGPRAEVKSFSYSNGAVVALPNKLQLDGTMDRSTLQEPSIYAEGKWEQLLAPIQAIAHAGSKEKSYFGTINDGLYVIKENELTKITDPSFPENSTILAVHLDPKGNLWASLNDFPDHLLKMDTEGLIRLIKIEGLERARQIVSDRAGNIWLVDQTNFGRNLRVFNEKNGLNRTFGVEANSGGLPSNRIRHLAMDAEKNLWIGTSQGVAFFPNAPAVSASNAINAIVPLFENRPALGNLAINRILIAPDNSKWFGTETDGIWHFSEDFEDLTAHFSPTNSPLPSSRIVDLVLDDKSGEIFITTPKGALSYRAGSIRAADKLESLKIYPNPVRSDFTGPLSIEGLTDYSVLKITTSSGRVVATMVVKGGKITWNLRDPGGNKISPGIYMVYVVDGRGREKTAGKFLVM